MSAPRKYPRSPLAAARIAARLTQQELADAIGVHITSVQRMERGETPLANISAKLLISISDTLGVDPHSLLQ